MLAILAPLWYHCRVHHNTRYGMEYGTNIKQRTLETTSEAGRRRSNPIRMQTKLPGYLIDIAQEIGEGNKTHGVRLMLFHAEALCNLATRVQDRVEAAPDPELRQLLGDLDGFDYNGILGRLRSLRQ